MDDWKHALERGLVSGSAASVCSAAALAACGARENRSPYGAVNAISHWVWGDRAALQNRPSWRYTALGYGIHHASSVFWAVLYQRFFRRRLAHRRPGPVLAAAAATAAMACFTDYQLTPRRLQPGFEMRLSKASLALVYGAFALGLAAGVLCVSGPSGNKALA